MTRPLQILINEPPELSQVWIGIAGIVATIVVGLLGVRISYMVARPKKEITASIQYQASYLDELPSYRGKFQTDDEASSPVYAHITISNTGKRPITATEFHADLPLDLDLTAVIVRVNKVESRPRTYKAMPIRISPQEPSVLNAGPGLLNQSQTIDIYVTLNSKGELGMKGSLIDVKLTIKRFNAATQLYSLLVMMGSGFGYVYFYARDIAKVPVRDVFFSPWRENVRPSLDKWVNAFSTEPIGFFAGITCLLLAGAAIAVYAEQSFRELRGSRAAREK